MLLKYSNDETVKKIYLELGSAIPQEKFFERKLFDDIAEAKKIGKQNYERNVYYKNLMRCPNCDKELEFKIIELLNDLLVKQGHIVSL